MLFLVSWWSNENLSCEASLPMWSLRSFQSCKFGSSSFLHTDWSGTQLTICFFFPHCESHRGWWTNTVVIVRCLAKGLHVEICPRAWNKEVWALERRQLCVCQKDRDNSLGNKPGDLTPHPYSLLHCHKMLSEFLMKKDPSLGPWSSHICPGSIVVLCVSL